MGKIRLVKNVLLLRPCTKVTRVLPMGLLYLASYIKERNRNINVRILDLRMWDNLDIKRLQDNIYSFKPDLIGITSLSLELNETLDLAKFMQKEYPDSKIILGGPLASTEYELLSKLDLFEHIIVGEGEEVLCDIVKNKASNKKVLFSHEFKEVDMNLIKYPDYSLINVKQYFDFSSHEAFQINKEYAPIFTSRGCPFDCAFCFHMFGKKVRFRNIINVVDEIEYLVKNYGIKEVHIEDDVFNIDKKRVVEFFKLLNERNIHLKISFPNGVTYKTLDEEIIRLFKKNGVYRVCLGIEHTSPRIMKLISKEHNINTLNHIINLLNKSGIMTHGFFITGFPTETVNDFKYMSNFILKSKLHTFRISRYIPFYGTRLYDEFAKKFFENRTLEDITKAKYHSTSINYSDMPIDFIEKSVVSLNRKFYTNPCRILKILSVLKISFIIRNLSSIIKYVFTARTGDGT